jgi:glycosyltransferase involved in cell wall biosynthesis
MSTAEHSMAASDLKRAPITAVILTKNEELRLEKALASLQFCKRVAVLDSGSTDGTADVAHALGVDFVVHIPDAPFRISEQRNWALDNLDIKTPWVLYLDADEEIPRPLAEELHRISTTNAITYDAFELTPRYLFWGRWLKRTQGYPNWHPRFVRHGHARFAGGVWEHFGEGIRVGRITEPYDHYANCKGLRDWLDRHYRYASWDADRVIAALDSGDFSHLGTARKVRLRRWAARLWPLRPIMRFVHMYFLRLGFLEGVASLNFCLLYAFYELMIVNLIVERRRVRAGKDL